MSHENNYNNNRCNKVMAHIVWHKIELEKTCLNKTILKNVCKDWKNVY